MFEKAARLKLRFESPKGLLTVEELWDLPLTSSRNAANLDDIARGLNRQLKNADDVSFVNKEQKSDEKVQLKFDLVKRIIDTRLAENEAAAKARERAERKQKLLSIVAEREDDTLKAMPLEELRKLLNEL
jgi:hypothetical protein